jgi:hypothetical protein
MSDFERPSEDELITAYCRSCGACLFVRMPPDADEVNRICRLCGTMNWVNRESDDE